MDFRVDDFRGLVQLGVALIRFVDEDLGHPLDGDGEGDHGVVGVDAVPVVGDEHSGCSALRHAFSGVDMAVGSALWECLGGHHTTWFPRVISRT